MLLSMTGHGGARCSEAGIEVAVEVRTVNNRYLKISCRTTDGYGGLEPQIEALVRKTLRRGSVQLNVRIDREPCPEDYRLDTIVLTSYRNQIDQILADSGESAGTIGLQALLGLPGVVDERAIREVDAESVWPLVERAVGQALQNLTVMRRGEGEAMAADLTANCRLISELLEQIEARAPVVVDAFRRRLTERLNKLLEEHGVRVEMADVVREVGIFAERCDIAEEIVRLKSHLNQFAAIVDQPESNGRKLEFLIQEMLRETNTIGSKANDADIAHAVIEIKSVIERMREMIQNVE